MAMVAVGAACIVTAFCAYLRLREPAPSPENAATDASARAQKTRALGLLSARYLVGTLLLRLLFVAMLTISYCLNSWLPTLLVKVGWDERFAALSVSIFSFGGIVAALGVGVLIDRFGAMRTLLTFLTLSTVLLYAVGQVLGSASADSADGTAGCVRVLRAGRVWRRQRHTGRASIRTICARSASAGRRASDDSER